MAATESTMLPLGTPLPGFRLPDARTGAWVDSSTLTGARGTVVVFMCNHCPYVIHLRAVMVPLLNQAVADGFSVIAINANSEQTHPQDGPVHMAALAAEAGFRFPFLFDATQEVARRFQAACTPEFYVFDRQARLAYRGQFDGSRPGNEVPVTGADLSAALAAVRAGEPPEPTQQPSIGCSIKWHPSARP